MANTIVIKRRISSVKSTRQITKAMELVAASKMRRAQEYANKTRDYHDLARSILMRLRQLTDVNVHPLFRQRAIKTRLHLIITSDRGLAGAYNNNLFKKLTEELQKDHSENVTSQIIGVGKQGGHYISRLKNVEVLAIYEHLPEQPTANDIRPILNTIISLYEDKAVDAVDVIFTDYISTINQLTTTRRLLPAAFEEIEIDPDLGRAEFEPSSVEVLDEITHQLIEAQLNQLFSESQASEQTMRMMAMKNATDNASDLIDDLTLEFNSVRQAAITQELAEITSGAEAIR